MIIDWMTFILLVFGLGTTILSISVMFNLINKPTTDSGLFSILVAYLFWTFFAGGGIYAFLIAVFRLYRQMMLGTLT